MGGLFLVVCCSGYCLVRVKRTLLFITMCTGYRVRVPGYVFIIIFVSWKEMKEYAGIWKGAVSIR